MNEAETRAELIDPALKAAGWGVVEAFPSTEELWNRTFPSTCSGT